MHPWHPLFLTPFLALTLAACGGDVIIAASSGTGGGTSTSTGATCTGTSFPCLQFCGSDYFPANSTCIDGAWTCPPGTVNPSTCPPDICGGLPLPCETCDTSGWVCKPDAACLAGCPSLACAECPGAPITVSGCTCACDGNGQFSCTQAACCVTDNDCGDLYLIPCVTGVCKQPVMDGCWSDEECSFGPCVGAFVCPCAADCDQPDHPGTCATP